MIALRLITTLLLNGCVVLLAAGFSQSPSSKYWVTDGTVSCITTDSDTIYIGGDFTRVGPWTGSGVTVDLQTGESLAQSPRVQGRVFCAISDSVGGWFIGGSFSRVGELNRTNLAHITADNRVNSAWSGAATSSVLQLALHNGVLYVASSKTQDSSDAVTVSAVDAANGAKLTFRAEADSGISALCVRPDALLLAGSFRAVNGIPRDFVAALAHGSGELLPWDPLPHGAWVTSIATYGDTVFVGGTFSSIGGEPRTNLAAVSFATGKALAWNPNTALDASANYFYRVHVFETNLYVAGSFARIGDFARTNIAIFDLPSGDVNAWQPAGVTGIAAIGVSKEYLVTASIAPGLPLTREARLLTAFERGTGAIVPLNITPNFDVWTVPVFEAKLFMGGFFSGLGPYARRSAAAFDKKSGHLLPWNPNVESNVMTMAISTNRVFLGGRIDSVAGETRRNLAAVDKWTGDLVKDWRADAQNYVSALALKGETLYAGGGFAAIGNAAIPYLAAISADSGAIEPWNPGIPGGAVGSLLIDEDRLYVGGTFWEVRGQLRRNIAAFDLLTRELLPWNPQIKGNGSSVVLTLAADAEKVYFGGIFVAVGDLPRRNAAAVYKDGMVSSWAPDPVDNGTGLKSLAVTDDSVVLAGGFYAVQGQYRSSGLAMVDKFEGKLLPWHPNSGFNPECVTVDGDALLLGYPLFLSPGDVRLGLVGFEKLSNSRILAATLRLRDGGRVQFSAQASVGAIFDLQVSANLSDWTTMQSVTFDTEEQVIIADRDEHKQLSFYRLISHD